MALHKALCCAPGYLLALLAVLSANNIEHRCAAMLISVVCLYVDCVASLSGDDGFLSVSDGAVPPVAYASVTAAPLNQR